MSREQKAQIELDKALERFKKNYKLGTQFLDDLSKAISTGKVPVDILNDIILVDSNSGFKKIKLGVDGANILAGVVSDLTKGQDSGRVATGFLADGGMFVFGIFAKGLSPVFLAIDIMNLIDKNTFNTGGFDFRARAQDIYDWLTNTTSDLPDPEALKRGILQITMPDGTVYARPLVERLGISTDGGFKKDDVLFGGSGNDKLIGTWNSSDLLIGGDGYDRYEATHKNIIKDSDGKGIVYFGDKLTGGKYNKEKGVYISDDGLVEYKLSGRTLSVKRGEATLTIENYDKDESSLGIALLEQGEISINVNDRTKNEGDEGEQFLPFNISVSGDIPQGEYAIVEVKGKYYLFGKPAKDDTAAWEYINSLKIEGSNHYFHTWQGNNEKNDDVNFEITPTVVKVSDGLKVKNISGGEGTIKDDDDDFPPKPNLPDPTNTSSQDFNSPLVLDLNNNSITSTKLDDFNKHLSSNTYFDFDNSGFKKRTSWIENTDALLALDKNGNGLIDSIDELFGSNSSLNIYNKDFITNDGFDELSKYDLNKDNIIDDKDEIYSKLRVWQDLNSNGITDDGELKSLKEHRTNLYPNLAA